MIICNNIENLELQVLALVIVFVREFLYFCNIYNGHP